MGELKGQILGVLLVLLTFGLLVTAFSGIFNDVLGSLGQTANGAMGQTMDVTSLIFF
jgi:hypothetical protein